MEILKFPRGYFLFSTEERIISSEVSFHSSEVSFDSSEVLLLAHVENFLFPRGYLKFPTWRPLTSYQQGNYCEEAWSCPPLLENAL